ncbi:MAG: arsenate reductase ArsC [Thermoanaerobaculum sp.]
MEKLRVLVLCTGNSCRSQMAEGWLRYLLGDRVEVASAGTHPAVAVHPLAVQVMAEAGVDISHHRPKHVDKLSGMPWDLVITVCDSAKEESPYFPNAHEQIHVGFPDPVAATGTQEERLAVYREVRDAIRDRLVPEVKARLAERAEAS